MQCRKMKYWSQNIYTKKRKNKKINPGGLCGKTVNYFGNNQPSCVAVFFCAKIYAMEGKHELYTNVES